MDKVKWGILGTSAIFAGRVMTGIRSSKHVEVSAIGSRSLDRARAMASECNVPRAYGSYEELLADPDIEAVYNPLPNHMHLEWSKKVLESGKHLLCEKPLAMNTPQAEELHEVSKRFPHLKVMEAFMYRLHPQWVKIKDILRSGEIGELRFIQTNFSFTTLDPDDIRNKPECGGGALMDIGGYCISLARYIFEDEPKSVLGVMEKDPQFGIDRITSGILNFEGGSCNFTCSIQLPGYQRSHILGSTGRLEVEYPFGGPPDIPWRIWHHRGSDSDEISFDVCNQYALEFDSFSLAILNDTDVFTPLSDGVNNMKIIDAIIESAETRSWVSRG